MRELEEKILKDGKVLDNDILVVGAFLNQNIDIALLKSMAKEVRSHFDTKVDKVLTVEASGLPFATAVAMEYGCDMIFAKKSMTSNLSGNIAKASLSSYTHKNEVNIVLNKDYVKPKDRVLIVDDFLALGNAFKALLELANSAEMEVVGFSACVEKEYQNGGNQLREMGYDVFSLAKIKSMKEKKIVF